jgi:hypothetical protein
VTDNQPRYTTARLRHEVDAAKRLARINALEEAVTVVMRNAPATQDFADAGLQDQARRTTVEIRALIKEEKV